jgi:hypothetical protein
VRVAGACFVAWVAFGAIRTFAGQSTELSVALSLALTALFEIKFVAAITLAGSCAVWAVAERIVRRWKTDQLARRIRELETEIDPNRSTSGLTSTGRTNPRDRMRP